MKRLLTILVLGLGACSSAQHAAPSCPAPAAARPAGLQIRHAAIYVDDQDKALRFYTDVVGFAAKDDVANGPYRWLTVTAAGDGDGTELQLAKNDDPAAKAYQQAMFAAHQPATMLYTDDVQRDYARMKAKGATFTMPPTDVTYATIAMFDDTCGNLVQITQLGGP